MNSFLCIGAFVYLFIRVVLRGFFVVNQNERAVKTVFGKAKRVSLELTENSATLLREDERERYDFPELEVIQPGGPYFKWPWEKVYKVSIATNTVNMAFDPECEDANHRHTVLDAVTKDQLNIELSGQLRYRVSERNIYAFLFGVRNPLAHIMGYFVSVLRERIANFDGNPEVASEKDDLIAVAAAEMDNISINDLRKNLRDINNWMDSECAVSESRYGVILEASLITGIDPPSEVDSALAAINTAHNQVSSDISLAKATADQTIVQSRRVVEIETLKAESEVEGLHKMSNELLNLKTSGGSTALRAYVHNARLGLVKLTKAIYKSERGQF